MNGLRSHLLSFIFTVSHVRKCPANGGMLPSKCSTRGLNTSSIINHHRYQPVAVSNAFCATIGFHLSGTFAWIIIARPRAYTVSNPTSTRWLCCGVTLAVYSIVGYNFQSLLLCLFTSFRISPPPYSSTSKLVYTRVQPYQHLFREMTKSYILFSRLLSCTNLIF